MRKLIRNYFLSYYCLSKSVFVLRIIEVLECVVTLTCFVKSMKKLLKSQKKLLLHTHPHGNLIATSAQHLVKHPMY